MVLERTWDPCGYGPLHFVLAAFALSGVALTFLSTFQCNFFEASYGLSKYEFINPDFAAYRGVGIWTIEKDGACVTWSDDKDVDIYMLIGRIMSLCACLFSVIFVLMTFVPCCSRVGGDEYMKKISQFFLLMVPISGLMLLALLTGKCADAYSCEASTGFYLGVGAVGSWLAASLTARFTKARPLIVKGGDVPATSRRSRKVVGSEEGEMTLPNVDN